MGAGTRNKVSTEDYITCTCCGNSYSPNVLYISKSQLYKHYGKLPICKTCIETIYKELLVKNNDDKQKAIYQMCRKFDMPFSFSAYNGALKESEKKGWQLYQAYFQKMNSLGGVNNYGTCFDEGEVLEGKAENFNVTENQDLDFKEIEKNLEFTDSDKEVKNDVVRLMGYDPFAGYSIFDQKFLYNELLPYLDEDTLDDTFKLSQIVQLVNNNNQIRKLDLVINNISSNTKALLTNHGEIKSLTAIKNQIVQSTDKIAKENTISVKNRGDKSAGKSTLTYMMKNYRELGFEDAEQDYYDQNKARGIRLVADISHKSLLEQLQFDENDKNDMFFIQRQLIQELQTKVADLEEENRQLYVKISKEKIGEE